MLQKLGSAFLEFIDGLIFEVAVNIAYTKGYIRGRIDRIVMEVKKETEKRLKEIEEKEKKHSK